MPKALLTIIIFLMPFYLFRFAIGPIPSSLLEVGIYLTFLYFLLSGNLKLGKKSKIIWPAAIFLIFGLVGALLDPELSRGLGLWKGYFFDGFLVYLMIISQDDTYDYLPAIFYSGALVAVLTLIVYSSGVKSLDGRLLDLERLSPNYLAMFLTPILIIGLFVCAKTRLLVNYLALAVIFASLALTGSRGTLVALSGSVIILIYQLLRKMIKKVSVVALIVMLLVFFIGGYLVFGPDWSDHGRKSTSSNVRYHIWSTSLEMIGREPIWGVGLGNFQNYFSDLTKDRVNYPEYISPVALTAHNLYIHFYLTLGLFGFLGFLYFLISSKFYSWRLPVLSLTIWSILFYSLVDTHFFRNDLAILFWVLIALCYRKLPDAKKV